MCLWSLCNCCLRQPKLKNGAYLVDPSSVQNEKMIDEEQPTMREDKHNIKTYTAQQNYSRSSKTEIDFKKGDKIELLDEVDASEPWSQARNIRTNKTGYVALKFLEADLESHLWYFKDTAMDAAEKLLLWAGNENGTFLVRPHDYPKSPYALSVRTSTENGKPVVKHYRIFKENNKFYISPNLQLPSLHKLIQAYLLVNAKTELKLCENITKPCSKVDTHQYDLSTEGPLQLKIHERDIDMESEPIGSGNFSSVYKGRWNNKTVAVKIPKIGKFSQEDLIKELKITKEMQHKNIVTLWGVCSTQDNCHIILEYMDGSLEEYIKTNDITEAQKIHVATQIACAMTYLESKKIVHRDLAARNVLYKQNLIVKLADFGLSKFLGAHVVYVAKSKCQLAIRWLAPECLKQCSFNTKSDVWSFGLLIMEIYKRGERPFNEIRGSISPTKMLKHIEHGIQISRPKNMSQDIYDFVRNCWNLTPEDRHTFMEIQNYFETYLLVRGSKI